jgi:hypothetical protein
MTHLDDVIHNACMHANLRTLLVLTKTTTKVTRNVAFLAIFPIELDPRIKEKGYPTYLFKQLPWALYSILRIIV